MYENNPILRHVTKDDYINSIVREGALLGRYGRRKGDNKYISFELNPTTNTLVEVFHILKEDWSEKQSFELLFDVKKLEKDGYKINSTIDGKYFTNKEIDLVMEAHGLPKVSNRIGKYAFIKDKVPLRYLTVESKNHVIKFVKNETDMSYDEVKSLLT